MKPLRKVLTKKNFKEYLTKMPPNKRVGVKDSSESCPLANLIKSEGYTRVRVGEDMFNVTTREGNGFLPKWAHKFIDTVDSLCSPKYVTAKKALKILEN